MASVFHVVNPPHDHETRGRLKKASLRDMLSSMEARVARNELAIGEMRDRFEDIEERIEVQDSKREKLREEMQGVLNESMDALTQKDENLEAMMVAMREEMDELKKELTACKTTIGGGILAMIPSPRVDVPKPKEFKGARSTKEVDNFLWGMERYFRASNITIDVTKISTASTYLVDIALLWWCRRCDDERHGVLPLRPGRHSKQSFANNSSRSMRKIRHKQSCRDLLYIGKSKSMCGSSLSLCSKFQILGRRRQSSHSWID